MNRQMTARQYLERIYKLDRKINEDLKRKAEYREMAFSISRDTTKPHYNPNHTCHASYEKFIEKSEEMEKRITDETDMLADLKMDAMEKISGIDDETCRTILISRYVKLNRWADVIAEVGLHERWVYRKHNMALEKLQKLL